MKKLNQSKKSNNDIDKVDEEEEIQESSNKESKQASSRQSESQLESRRTREDRSEQQDKEILESTSSVDWIITLQNRNEALNQGDQSAPEPSGRDGITETEEGQSYSEMPEEIDEQDEIDGEELEDLQSNPSGSLKASKSDDI